MRKSQLEKHHEKIVAEITLAENSAGITGLNSEYPYASDIERIRKSYFEHPDVEVRKQLIRLRMSLSKAFIADAQHSLNIARIELNRAKFRGPKTRIFAAVVAVLMFSPVYDNYGIAGTVTALFVLYMIASYYDHASRVKQEEALDVARIFFDQCRDRLIEAKRATCYFTDSEIYDGQPSKYYKLFESD